MFRYNEASEVQSVLLVPYNLETLKLENIFDFA